MEWSFRSGKYVRDINEVDGTVSGIVGANAGPNWREMKASANWQADPAATNCSFCITDHYCPNV